MLKQMDTRERVYVSARCRLPIFNVFSSLPIASDEAESVALEVQLRAHALLIVGDSFFPGWQAELYGCAVTMLRANGGLARAVEVPPGEHSVTMIYRPDSFRLGLQVSLAALLVLPFLLSLLGSPRWRTVSSAPPPSFLVERRPGGG
jgi:hypothetical protein